MQKLFLILIILFFYSNTEKKDSFEPVVVLELFTSQGCSSCPSADELLKNIKFKNKQSEVITLSYHVDYWNYIGWKDPFSKSDYTDKQRDYSRKFNTSTIYTPQIVVNGKEHFVGSNKTIMDAKLKSYLKTPSSNNIKIYDIKKDADGIDFKYEIEGKTFDKRMRFILVINERNTEISRGENRNRVLKNDNIVVEEFRVKINKTTGNARIVIPEVVKARDKLSLIAIVETSNLDITGGFQIML
ncbi:DUF1223 domain-containing protein [Algibacter aquimarinus]|uniref:DUF1223 domain-containing protein n=1 Tax=Algibacter aquimarinus TaxID=1136748 RepID=A0ABP9HNQ4_9FLAO